MPIRVDEKLLILDNMGYKTKDERFAMLEATHKYRPPYKADFEEQVKWAEFCMAIAEQDFAIDDEFVLNGVSFLVTYVDV